MSDGGAGWHVAELVRVTRPVRQVPVATLSPQPTPRRPSQASLHRVIERVEPPQRPGGYGLSAYPRDR
jgi:hypothetical protein